MVIQVSETNVSTVHLCEWTLNLWSLYHVMSKEAVLTKSQLW